MLAELIIKNFAIIDDLKISFQEGLNIISGETGAGKSILINAVNLLLGKRATASAIRDNCSDAQIQALFYLKNNNIAYQKAKEQGFNPDDGLLVKRIISKEAKSKIYINGNLANLAILSDITENLANVSSQHAHQKLLDEKEHLFILDKFCQTTQLQLEVKKIVLKIKDLSEKLFFLEAESKKQQENINFLKFQKEEIKELNIKGEQEFEELLSQKEKQKNQKLFSQTIESAMMKLYEDDNAIIPELINIKKKFDKISEFDEAIREKAQNIDDARFILEDFFDELRKYNENFEDKSIEEIEERLNDLQKCKRKYDVQSLDEIIEHYDNICKKLQEIENISYETENIKNQITTFQKILKETSSKLSQKRYEGAKIIENKILENLQELNMGKRKFKVLIDTIKPSENENPYLIFDDKVINQTGEDKIRFMLSADMAGELKSLKEIASGGELSRFVLILKSILAEKDFVETIIFDETDAGVGGETAELIGKKIYSISAFSQVICISHLAQIAKFGQNHLYIYKEFEDNKAITKVKSLDESMRKEEIARMIGGKKITELSLKHADELLSQNKD